MFQTLSSRWCNFAQGSHACATIVPRRRRSQGKCRMTLGGVTGLQDCLLLPPVRAKTEDSCSREYLLLTCLRLHVQAGTRPMGICVDNLEQCFQAIARSLQAAYPAQVQLCYGEEWPLPHEAEDGHIYIQMTQKKAWASGCAKTHCIATSESSTASTLPVEKQHSWHEACRSFSPHGTPPDVSMARQSSRLEKNA